MININNPLRLKRAVNMMIPIISMLGITHPQQLQEIRELSILNPKQALGKLITVMNAYKNGGNRYGIF